MTRFDYRRMPACAFRPGAWGRGRRRAQRQALFETLDKLRRVRLGLDGDALLMHHYGLGVDVGPWHGCGAAFCGQTRRCPRFAAIDFTPEDDRRSGPPYRSSSPGPSSPATRRRCTGARATTATPYDVTRNIILGQGVNIPYPRKYWTCSCSRTAGGGRARPTCSAWRSRRGREPRREGRSEEAGPGALAGIAESARPATGGPRAALLWGGAAIARGKTGQTGGCPRGPSAAGG